MPDGNPEWDQQDNDHAVAHQRGQDSSIQHEMGRIGPVVVELQYPQECGSSKRIPRRPRQANDHAVVHLWDMMFP